MVGYLTGSSTWQSRQAGTALTPINPSPWHTRHWNTCSLISNPSTAVEPEAAAAATALALTMSLRWYVTHVDSCGAVDTGAFEFPELPHPARFKISSMAIAQNHLMLLLLCSISRQLSMTGLAGLGRFRVAVATETGSRINTPFNPVTRQEIAPVLNPTVVLGRIFNRWLELDPGCMAITAKTLAVADRTDPLILIGDQTVRIGKQRRMVVTFEIQRFLVEAMTFGAELPSLPQFMNHRMGCRKPVSPLCRAGDQQRR